MIAKNNKSKKKDWGKRIGLPVTSYDPEISSITPEELHGSDSSSQQ